MIKKHKANIAEKKAAYLAIVHTAPAAEVKKASEAVRDAQRELVLHLTEGAEPCPDCGNAPHGMEQNRSDGKGIEFEIGCSYSCSAFLHDDGTIREHRARGALPQHAIEVWNAGPDFWMTKAREKFSDDAFEKLKPRPAKESK